MAFRHDLLLLLALATITTLNGCSERAAKSPEAAGDEHAHEGDGAHSHDEEADLEPIVVTHFSEKVQLFMEYPPLVRGKRARFLAHVTVLATGEPVRSGRLELELVQPDGSVVSVVADKPERDGLFIPIQTFNIPGTYTGRIIIKSPQVEDEFEFRTVVIHAGNRSALAAANARVSDQPEDAIPFLLEQQWPIEFFLAQARSRILVKRLSVSGETVPAGGAAAAVSPPVAGRLLPPISGGLPMIGQRVEKGQVLGFIEPAHPVTEAMQLAANESWLEALKIEILFRGLDLSMKQVEIDQVISQAETHMEFSKRAFERIAKLKDQGLRTDEQYDEASRALQIAQAELAGALGLKASFELALAELEQIQSISPLSVAGDHEGSDIHQTDHMPARLPVFAPISGTIVEVDHIEGEYVEAVDELYRIINAESVWVVAHVPEFDLAELTDSPHANISLPAYPDESFDIAQLGGRLVNVGIAVDQSSRTLPLVYELPNPDGRFQIGLLVDVHLGTKKAQNAVSIPISAIVPDSGRATVYVLLDGENFQRREVVLGIRDGEYIEVMSGVESGEWVVSHGGNAVRLAALSPASFGHGHAH